MPAEQVAAADRGPILIVDDEPDLRRLLEFNLTEAGYTLELASTGSEALAIAADQQPFVVVLDLMLPDIPGTEVCRRLRAHPLHHDVGILMLTARNEDYDRIVSFELGCDDFVVKPFNVRELTLRVRALCRRVVEQRAAQAAFAAGGGGDASGDGTRGFARKILKWRSVSVDTARHRVEAEGVELRLRPLEFRLLTVLLENVGIVLSRDRLLDEVWSAEVSPRTVDTHVKRLRQRLGAQGECIETVVGVGYRVKDP